MLKKVLIANRGEIAVRLVRALRDLGLASVAVHARDDAMAACNWPTRRHWMPPAPLRISTGGADRVARDHGCDAVLRLWIPEQRTDFAQACADTGLRFIGPTPSSSPCPTRPARVLASNATCQCRAAPAP